MARSPDYIVKRGDSLWKIATNHASKIAGSTTQAKVNTLALVNGIKNPNLIYVGQNIYFSGSVASNTSSSTSPTSATDGRKINTVKIGLQSANETTSKNRAVYADWSYNGTHKKNTASYKYRWWEKVNGSWRITSEGTTTSHEDAYCYATHTANETDVEVGFQVLPVSKTYKDGNGNDQYYFTEGGSTSTNPNHALWSDRVTYEFKNNPPLAPGRPDVEINNNTLTLTASISNIDPAEIDAEYVVFNIVRDNSTSLGESQPVKIVKDAHYVYWQYTAIEAGHTYTVRAKSWKSKGKESGWSDFSEVSATKPSAPTILEDKCRRVKREDGSIAAHVEWKSVATAETYKIEYVTTKTDFETTPGNIQSVTTDTARTSIEIVINELGLDYYFRVKAINKDNLESEPSAIAHIPLGKTPVAPATWSTADSAFVDDTMELHWTHQTEDRSKQTAAQLSLNINGGGWTTVGTFENTTDADNTGERIDEVPYTYGKSVSYKGTLYFKMDTSVDALRDATILWRVRTKGITDDFGDWSVERTIHIYEKPTLALTMTSDIAGTEPLITTLTSFPFYVQAKDSLTGSSVQKPVGYHLQIIANEYYNTIDDIGRTKTVNAGDTVYSKYFSTSEELIIEMSANNVDLESGVNYTLYCMEDMSTGLTITNQHDFTVNWTDAEYPISADISVDTDSYTALISPYCANLIPMGPAGKNLFEVTAGSSSRYGVDYVNNNDGTITFSGKATQEFAISLYKKPRTYDGTYTISVNQPLPIGVYVYIEYAEGSLTKEFVLLHGDGSTRISTKTIDIDGTRIIMHIPADTEFNNFVFRPQLEAGFYATEYETYVERYEDGDLIDTVSLSVYRREYDGTFTEVASGIPNNRTAVTDPHPALDYARYRFVAKDIATGAISFYDMPGYPVNCSSIILQWDEDWSTFDDGENQILEGVSWSGSLLRLPYNIKVTDNRKPEVALVEYAGRRHPVSYYGTQVGETSTWNTDIPKTDKETVYALRRLSLWSGDVYVREPSGMGYWANVEVSFNQSYNEVTIPVTLNITRVEGGV